MKRCGADSGQAVLEYVIFLALVTVLALVLIGLSRTMSAKGEKTVEHVTYNVP